MDYASSGVDIDLEGAAVASLIGSLQRSTRKAGTPGAPVDLPGGFGGLIEFGSHLLAMATDGVGSKLQIATAVKQWGSVGIDCMAIICILNFINRSSGSNYVIILFFRAVKLRDDINMFMQTINFGLLKRF